MNHLFNLIKKEVKELLTPASILPIIVVAIMFASIGSMTGSAISDSQDATASIAVVNLDTATNDSYSQLAIDAMLDLNATIVYNGSSLADIETAIDVMKAQGADAVLVFTADYTTDIQNGSQGIILIYWNMVGTGIFDSLSTTSVYTLISTISSETAKDIINDAAPALDADNATTPVLTSSSTIFGDMVMNGIDPLTVSSLLESQGLMMPILIMIVIVMVGGIIISSMGMEKENKTLETLLTLPVNRTTIVAGKLVGSAVVGLVFGIIYMAGMAYYMQGFNLTSADYDLAQYGLSLDMFDWVILAVMLFLTILCALGLCMILGAFAKNYKAAQSLTMPISLLAMIPMFIVMFTDFNTLPTFLQVVVFIIPFSHPMMAMNNLMFGNDTMIMAGLAYLSVFTLVTIMATVRLYKSDVLLTGFRFKKEDLSSLSIRSVLTGRRR